MIVDYDHQVKVSLLVHGTKAVDACERNDGRERLSRAVQNERERFEYVATLVFVVGTLQEDEDVFE